MTYQTDSPGDQFKKTLHQDFSVVDNTLYIKIPNLAKKAKKGYTKRKQQNTKKAMKAQGNALLLMSHDLFQF